MAKVIKKEIKLDTQPLKVVEVSGDVVVGFTPCFKCGKPSTIRSNKGHVFCDLACQTAAGE
jgi:hypothetical protein